ncbi:MAG: hypothetical protein ABEJ22_01130 [Haloferacaceae archaeon]
MARANRGSETPQRASVTVVAVGVLVALLVVGIGGMYVLGVGPLAGGGDAQTSPVPGPTATDSSGSSNGTSAPAGHERPFTFVIDDIETCGNTCRDVTVTLTNNGGNARSNVTVTTTMYAGNDSVWTGEESVGTLDADESTTRTQRVDVGYVGGAKIKQNGGTVTVVTVVRWDGGSATFREKKQVA